MRAQILAFKCSICKKEYLRVEFYLNSNIFWKLGLRDKIATFSNSFCSLECLNVFLKKFKLQAIPEHVATISFFTKVFLFLIKVRHKVGVSEKLKNTPYKVLEGHKGGKKFMTLAVYIKDLIPINKMSNKEYISHIIDMEKAIIKMSKRKKYLDGNTTYDIVEQK